MSYSIQNIENQTEKSTITGKILRQLPEWFGIESAIVEYVENVVDMPFWVAESNGEPIGCLAAKIHFEKSAEIYVMGITKEFHRKGVGKAIVLEAERYLKEKQFEFFQVKTLSPSSKDKSYAKTREFYMSLGFHPFEEFKDLWDESNPCLQMVKKL